MKYMEMDCGFIRVMRTKEGRNDCFSPHTLEAWHSCDTLSDQALAA